MTRLDQKNEALILFTWLTVCFTCDWLQENTTFIKYETMLRPNRAIFEGSYGDSMLLITQLIL